MVNINNAIFTKHRKSDNSKVNTANKATNFMQQEILAQ